MQDSSASRPDWPRTMDEAVDRLTAILSPETKQQLREMTEDDAIFGSHFGLGMWIRNYFGLWQGNEDLLASCANADGSGFVHPDDASGVIVRALWQRVRSERVE